MEQRKIENRKPFNFMSLELKDVKNQVMVITGASSGIGLATARMAAEKGASLVLASRDEKALERVAEELKLKGTQAIYVTADVAHEGDVQKIVNAAIGEFGGFDTWVNNASVSIYGHVVDVPIEDMRQLFEINFWGYVYGSLAAVRHYKEKGTPGALINIGSLDGNRAVPLQTIYSASKFSVHGFTDGLRMELEKEHAPVSVTQIHPAKVNTPFTDHTTSYIDKYPSHQGMNYPPEAVAEAVIHAAQKPTRDIYVGTQAKFFSVVGRVFPRITDRYLEKRFYSMLYDPDREAKAPEEGILYHSGDNLHERGSNIGWERPRSLMVQVKKHPGITTVAVVGAGLLLLTAMEGKKVAPAVRKMKCMYGLDKKNMMHALHKKKRMTAIEAKKIRAAMNKKKMMKKLKQLL